MSAGNVHASPAGQLESTSRLLSQPPPVAYLVGETRKPAPSYNLADAGHRTKSVVSATPTKGPVYAATCSRLSARPTPAGPYTLAMAAADHTIRLPRSTYARLQAEAARSHRAIDEIAGELLDERLPLPIADREQAGSALARLAALRARVGRGVDAVALVGEGREELDRRIPSGE